MATRITIDGFARKLRTLTPELERQVILGARKAAARLVVDVTTSIETTKPFKPVDRGTMKQSVQMEALPKGAVVFVAVPYAEIQERGTRPYWPPLAPLVAWARRKQFDDPEAVARAVQAKIAREGIAPKWYFKRAVKAWRARGTLRREIAKRLPDVEKR